MDRDELAQMLEHEGQAFAACRRAVLAGAAFLISEGTVPARALFVIYRRRERITRAKQVPTLGFAEAVAALGARDDEPVLIGAVDTVDPPYHFQLFLNEASTAVIACLGVDASVRSTSNVGLDSA